MKILKDGIVVDADAETVAQRQKDLDQAEAERLPNARTAAYERAKARHAEALKAVKDRYPQTEIDGWSELAADAKEGSGVCIEAYAASMGISVADACDRILTVREGYRAAYGEATGELTKTRDLIDGAETVEDLEAIS